MVCQENSQCRQIVSVLPGSQQFTEDQLVSGADFFDYIVIGSGAGGGPLAARLAEAKTGYKVLLLEAGGDEQPWNYQVPVFHGRATEDEEMRLDHYVRHYE